MRLIVASSLALACIAAPLVASQTRGTGAAAKSFSGACALLTRDVVVKFASEGAKRFLDQLPPQEEPIGTHGSSCGYGGIHLQIDPFRRSTDLRKSPGKDWQPVSGVGDTAFFRNNSDRFAELMVWTGTRHFTIQMDVPTGASGASIKPKTIELANLLIPKLR